MSNFKRDDNVPPWKRKGEKRKPSANQSNRPVLVGDEVNRIADLSQPEDYYLCELQPGIYISVRRRKHIGKNQGNLPIAQSEFELRLEYPEYTALDDQLELLYLIPQLTSLFAEIYNATARPFARLSHPHGINMRLSFSSLEGSFTSSVRPLQQEDAMNASIVDLLDKLTNFTQSSKSDQLVTEMKLIVTITELYASGKGTVLPISDPNFRRKRLCKQSTNGSILYVNSQEKCFFISIFFGIEHRRLCTAHFDDIISSDRQDTYENHLKRDKSLAEDFYDLLELSGQELVDKTKTFFHSHSLDIEEYDDGSALFLKAVHDTFAYQVNIFDQTSQWELIQRWPEKYYANLPQINLIRVNNLIWSDKSRETKLDNYHYHGLSSLRKTIMGQLELSFCPFCAQHFHITHKEHICKEKKKELCYSCRRLKTSLDSLNRMCPENRIHFCARLPGTPMIKCDKCQSLGNNDFCLTQHKLLVCHYQRDICTKCNRKINRRSKYLDLNKTSHDNCSELWCQNCQEYYLDTEDHTCYIRRLKKAPKIPTGIAVFGK